MSVNYECVNSFVHGRTVLMKLNASIKGTIGRPRPLEVTNDYYPISSVLVKLVAKVINARVC